MCIYIYIERERDKWVPLNLWRFEPATMPMLRVALCILVACLCLYIVYNKKTNKEHDTHATLRYMTSCGTSRGSRGLYRVSMTCAVTAEDVDYQLTMWHIEKQIDDLPWLPAKLIIMIIAILVVITKQHIDDDFNCWLLEVSQIGHIAPVCVYIYIYIYTHTHIYIYIYI